MNDDSSAIPLQALPDGEAELRLVLHLRWEDIAALGQDAGRLAAQMQRPVSLDEAVSHRLRGRAAAHAKHSPGEQARQAIEKINGSVPQPPAAPPQETRGMVQRPTRHPSAVTPGGERTRAAG